MAVSTSTLELNQAEVMRCIEEFRVAVPEKPASTKLVTALKTIQANIAKVARDCLNVRLELEAQRKAGESVGPLTTSTTQVRQTASDVEGMLKRLEERVFGEMRTLLITDVRREIIDVRREVDNQQMLLEEKLKKVLDALDTKIERFALDRLRTVQTEVNHERGSASSTGLGHIIDECRIIHVMRTEIAAEMTVSQLSINRQFQALRNLIDARFLLLQREKDMHFVDFDISHWSKISFGALFSTSIPLRAWGHEFWLKVEKLENGNVGLYLCCDEHGTFPFSVEYQLVVRRRGSDQVCYKSCMLRTTFGAEKAWGLKEFATMEKIEREGGYHRTEDRITFGCRIFPLGNLKWGTDLIAENREEQEREVKEKETKEERSRIETSLPPPPPAALVSSATTTIRTPLSRII